MTTVLQAHRDGRTRANRITIAAAWSNALLALALAPVYGAWLTPLAIALPLAIAITFIARVAIEERFPRIAPIIIGVALVALAGSLVHQGRGLIALHFGLLVAIGVLVVYRDWRVIAAASITALGFVAAGYAVQASGVALVVFPPAHAQGWAMVGVHASYLAIGSLLIGAVAWSLQREHASIGAEAERRIAGSEAEREAGLAIAAERERLRAALDCASVNLRLADQAGTVTYANRAILATLTRLEPAIKQVNPAFSAATFVGRSITGIIAPSDHERALTRLQGLKAEVRSDFQIGGRTFEVITTPLTTATGESLGSMSQWIDRTEEVAAQTELARTVEAAVRGDFSRRVETAGKSGYALQMAEQLNELGTRTGAAMDELARVVEGLAEGDLTVRMAGEYDGVFAALKADTNRMAMQLTAVIARIARSGDSVNVASEEIARGNSDLAARTETQAAQLQQTAASMETLTTAVRENDAAVREATTLAAGATNVALRGGAAVRQVVGTMGEIANSSRRVQDIISVIDGIAFQTNILALNAAVEAARAGDQGKGFAVVASEVRNLAQRSAAAAKEIKTLITESGVKVDSGATLVADAGAQMEAIETAIRQVRTIIDRIAGSSAQQSVDIESVSRAIVTMDQGTQQNAALVEEGAASAESLREQATQLVEAVGQFRVARGTKAGLGDTSRPRTTAAIDPLIIHKPRHMSHG